MSENDEWPPERYPERLRIHGIGRAMTWAGTEPQEPWQEIIGYEDGEDDAPDSAVPYIRADVVEQRIAAARAEERESMTSNPIRGAGTAISQVIKPAIVRAEMEALREKIWKMRKEFGPRNEAVRRVLTKLEAYAEHRVAQSITFTNGAKYIRADVVKQYVAAARTLEREACATLADDWVHFYAPTHAAAVEARRIAAAIRARGKETPAAEGDNRAPGPLSETHSIVGAGAGGGGDLAGEASPDPALSARLAEAVEVIGFYADAGNWAVDRSDMEAPIVCGSDVKLPEGICFPHGGARARAFLAKQEGSDAS